MFIVKSLTSASSDPTWLSFKVMRARLQHPVVWVPWPPRRLGDFGHVAAGQVGGSGA